MSRREIRQLLKTAAATFEGTGFMMLLFGACGMDSEDVTIPLIICVAGLTSMIVGVLLDKLRRR